MTHSFVRRSCFLLLLLWVGLPASQAQKDGKTVFENRCASCHKISNQDLVGPGLANVNKRREQEWLIKFIKNSQKLIKDGDELANKLYNEYNQTIMPSHTDLSRAEITNTLDYVEQKSEGVAQQAVLSKNDEGQESEEQQDPSEQFSHLPQEKPDPEHKYNPNSTDFQLFFWMTSLLVVLLVIGFTVIVAKFSN
jgi:mono/diheme cytochrome c family protein